MTAAMTAMHTIPAVRESELARLAEDIAFAARPGDLIALKGELGAGKTTLARAIIQAMGCDVREEIPSPTFTLVQTYSTRRMPVAHLDLYRLNVPSELDELGLDHALNQGVALIEWPERAGGALPGNRLEILLEDGGGEPAAEPSPTRRMSLAGEGNWGPRLARLVAMRKLLASDGMDNGTSALSYLQGDASVRRYGRLTRRDGGIGAILMDWARQPDGPAIRNGLPYSRIAHLAEDVRPFVAVASALRALGLSVPQIYVQDLNQGFLLIEDLGDRVFGREIEMHPDAQPELWRAAAEALAALWGVAPPAELPVGDGSMHRLPDYDRGALLIEAELLLDWYWPALHGAPAPEDARAEFLSLWGAVFNRLAAMPAGWVLRDYHSPNLLWLPEREGIARVGVIDFQDAMRGPPAYDLVSLLQDARVDVAPELEAAVFDHYCAAVTARQTGFDRDAFAFAYAALGAQRNTKILGIFARLAKRDGKPAYLRHLPRLWGYLARDLAHPELAALAHWYDRRFPSELRNRTLA
jgi:hypothetical protein